MNAACRLNLVPLYMSSSSLSTYDRKQGLLIVYSSTESLSVAVVFLRQWLLHDYKRFSLYLRGDLLNYHSIAYIRRLQTIISLDLWLLHIYVTCLAMSLQNFQVTNIFSKSRDQDRKTPKTQTAIHYLTLAKQCKWLNNITMHKTLYAFVEIHINPFTPTRRFSSEIEQATNRPPKTKENWALHSMEN